MISNKIRILFHCPSPIKKIFTNFVTKKQTMEHDIFLYTLPQWLVFVGVIASVYGWVEKKKAFRMVGPVLFFLLGLFSLWVILKGYFSAFALLTPEEVVTEQMEEIIYEDIPFAARLFPAYILFIISGIIAVPSLILEWMNRRRKGILMIVTSLIGLMGFFIIVGALRGI